MGLRCADSGAAPSGAGARVCVELRIGCATRGADVGAGGAMSATSPSGTRKSARDKALAVNLDERRYGTFAEIGAGQEVVRWFFRAGGAAGTVAKSISAYDMTVSDAIYGPCARYVCRERLQAMLDCEQSLLRSRLSARRGDSTAFFAFADTVKAKSFRGAGECNGWMGIVFQSEPAEPESQIVIHLRMLDAEAQQQQEALGIVGVNLVYGAAFLAHDPDALLESLLDDLSTDRIEIDLIEFSGHRFRELDNRVMSLRLVQLGLAGVAAFGPDGAVLLPSDLLRGRSVLVERGRFRPVMRVHLDMLQCAAAQFGLAAGEAPPVELAEITMRNLLGEGGLDLRDFLDRADALGAMGYRVLISSYFEYWRLAAYLARHTNQRIGIVMGANALRELFDERFYEGLEGGILEGFGRLFRNDLRIYVHPFFDPVRRKLLEAHSLELPAAIAQLHRFVCERGVLVPLRGYDPALLRHYSPDVLDSIRKGDADWEDAVPTKVTRLIRQRGLFGHPLPERGRA
jgi:hypothetical protein